MQRKQFSTDGFVVRRRDPNGSIKPRTTLDSSRQNLPTQFLTDPTKKSQLANQSPVLTRADEGGRLLSGNAELALPKPHQKVELDLTLDDQPGSKKSSRPKVARKKLPRKKLIKRIAIVLLVIILAVGGYFAYKLLTTSGKIFQGNPIAAIFSQAKPLKEDANGQSNIVLFGTSEDDPDHPGADLTDSIMLLSVNQKRKDAFVVSIPRDLFVKYGKACVPGYQGRINSVYQCGNNEGGEDKGAADLRAKVGEIFGLDVQYSVHLNYTVLRQAVDAVGGITVDIKSDDPRGILDRNFDWDCPKGVYTCYNVRYAIGPANLDGKQALYLARARGDGKITYGMSRSNPDRQDNQRKILIALKEKAASAGVLTNPVSVSNLLDALGNNLRTNFVTEEIKTLIDLGQNVPSASIVSWSLEDPARPLATASCNGLVCVNKAPTDYSDIQKVALALSTGDAASLENAKIDVLNASGTAGVAQTKATELAAKNLTVGIVGNAPTSLAPQSIQFYDMTGGKKPLTLKKLESTLSVTVTAGKPAGISTNSDFVVIMGVQPAAPATANQ